jgi:WD40 repeat protein
MTAGVWLAGAVTGFCQQTVSFSRDIAPILIAKCQTCHGTDKPKGKYQLHTFEALLKPGTTGEPPIVAGQPSKSYFHQLLVETDPDNRMPQKDDPLPKEQIAIIARWITEGARFDGPDPQATLASLVPKVPHPEPPASYPLPVPVTALTFHPKQDELAVSGYHEVTLWHPNEGRLLRRIKGLPRQIQSLAFSPDGALLVVAGGTPGRTGELVLVDSTSGVVKQVLLTLDDALLTAAISPDGRLLAAAGSDNTIHLFELPSGRKRPTTAQHADWIMALAFSPDGRHIATASRDRTSRVFETATLELDATYAGHDSAVMAVAFSADGKTVGSAGRDKKIALRSASDGSKASTITGFDGDILELLAVGEHLFSAGADKVIRVHKLDDRSLVRTLEGHTDWVYALAADSKGSILASGSHDGEVRLWNLADGALFKSFKAAPGLVAIK